MTADAGIGIFDSGVGGLTVLHRLLETVPQEHLLYLGDTARHPYGTKSAAVVTRYSIENTRVEQRTDYEKLIVEIKTDGTIHPEEAIKGAARILIQHLMLVSDETEKRLELGITVRVPVAALL